MITLTLSDRNAASRPPLLDYLDKAKIEVPA